MQMRTMILVSCLISAQYISTMDYKGPVDPQAQSALTTLPSEIIPQCLWMDTTWGTVRSVLALQTTCRLWHSILNIVQKKQLVCLWVQEGKQFDVNKFLHTALQFTPQHVSLASAMMKSSWITTHQDVVNAQRACQVAAPELYLLAGADVDYADELGRTALIIAAETIDADDHLVSYLPLLIKEEMCVDKDGRQQVTKTNINHQDKEGNTALHVAAEQGAVHCVEVLLQHGASTTLVNHKGKTPILCIRALGRGEDVAQINRIRDLLNGTMTPEESIANPIGKIGEPSAKNALDALLDDDSTQPVNETFFG